MEDKQERVWGLGVGVWAQTYNLSVPKCGTLTAHNMQLPLTTDRVLILEWLLGMAKYARAGQGPKHHCFICSTGLAYTVEQGQKMDIVRTVPASRWLRRKRQNLKTHSAANVQACCSSFLVTRWKVLRLTKKCQQQKRQNSSFYKLIKVNWNERKERRRRKEDRGNGNTDDDNTNHLL